MLDAAGFPFLSRVPLMLGQVASLLMANEALAILHVLCSFTGREIDLVNTHGIGISGWSASFHSLSQRDGAISSTLKLPEPHHILVELSSLIEPLFPFPACLVLSFW